jgi:nitrogen fixation/metabolism regulation signal transduction histidine kinase
MVVDSGHGFDEEMMENLFEPYITDKVGGTGLGLAIVKKIVDEHGGRVWAENIKDDGARVTVLLPVLAIKQPHVQGLTAKAMKR